MYFGLSFNSGQSSADAAAAAGAVAGAAGVAVGAAGVATGAAGVAAVAELLQSLFFQNSPPSSTSSIPHFRKGT
jgi:hypothetical protein